MKIIANPIFCTIVDPKKHVSELAYIRTICRARPDNFQFMPRYKSGHWDGYISMMHRFNEFPTGLLPMIVDSNIGDKLEIIKNYSYNITETSVDSLQGITLRPYQLDAANAMLKNGRGVLRMATNSGKTEVMAAVLKALNLRAIIMVHRKELMYQTVQRFIDRGVDYVGYLGDGEYVPGNIMVTMIQTLSNKIYDQDIYDYVCKDNDVVIVDECHHLSSDQMLDIMKILPGKYRFGMSGTPLKHDILSDMKLIAYTGDIIYTVTNKMMIENGYSAKPVIRMIMIEGMDYSDILGYSDAYDEFIVKNDARNKLIVSNVKELTGVVLVMVSRLDHGTILKDMIPGSVFVHGSCETSYRLELLETMRSGKSGIYIASPIFDEGIDVPAVDAVVLAGGGKSYVKLLQKIGRGLRQKQGRNELLVLDFVDDTNKYLLQHSSERLSTYEQEGFEVQLV